jgi:hypothetical protein
MICFGIGLDAQSGFTLNLSIDKNSNKGKKIIQTLNAINFLTDFKAFGNNRTVTYLKDFGQKTELIIQAVQDLLANFKNGNFEQPYQVTVHHSEENFRIE